MNERIKRIIYAVKLKLSMNMDMAMKILDLSRSDISSPEILKKKYRELVKKHHPDVGGKTEKMQDINSAYDYINEKGHKEVPKYEERKEDPEVTTFREKLHKKEKHLQKLMEDNFNKDVFIDYLKEIFPDKKFESNINLHYHYVGHGLCPMSAMFKSEDENEEIRLYFESGFFDVGDDALKTKDFNNLDNPDFYKIEIESKISFVEKKGRGYTKPTETKSKKEYTDIKIFSDPKRIFPASKIKSTRTRYLVKKKIEK